jgi:hypothetical protein
MSVEFDFDAQADALHELLGEGETCIDCGNSHIQWASVTNGVWLCTSCSGKHRALGTHLSFVRSLTLDKWKAEHLMMMRVSGGNAKLRKVFSEDPFPDLSLEARYAHPLIVRYREALFDEVYARLGLDGPAERKKKQDDIDKWKNHRSSGAPVTSIGSSNAPITRPKPRCCGCF